MPMALCGHAVRCRAVLCSAMLRAPRGAVRRCAGVNTFCFSRSMNTRCPHYVPPYRPDPGQAAHAGASIRCQLCVCKISYTSMRRPCLWSSMEGGRRVGVTLPSWRLPGIFLFNRSRRYQPLQRYIIFSAQRVLRGW